VIKSLSNISYNKTLKITEKLLLELKNDIVSVFLKFNFSSKIFLSKISRGKVEINVSLQKGHPWRR